MTPVQGMLFGIMTDLPREVNRANSIKVLHVRQTLDIKSVAARLLRFRDWQISSFFHFLFLVSSQSKQAGTFDGARHCSNRITAVSGWDRVGQGYTISI